MGIRGPVLAIDASCPRSAVVAGVVEVTGERHGPTTPIASDVRVDGANQASTTLMSRIEAVLHSASFRVEDLAAIACGVGPGTFTGTRVAVATVKGLAFGLDVPVIAVSTLAAVALTLEPADEAPVLALLDARRGELYAAATRQSANGARWLVEPTCASLDAILAALLTSVPSTPVRAIGPGVGAAGGALEAAALETIEVPGPSADGLWRAVCSPLAVETSADELAANYLRRTYAELGINTPRRPVFHNPLLD